ncbi:MAG: bstEII [Anaerolineae bacterium]|nr:bstEII [Anaerolineae bacterium]
MSESKQFSDYKSQGHQWITLATGEYYPDILHDAKLLYTPVLVLFGQLVQSAETSQRLLLMIAEIPNQWMRIQVARVFRKYVSPNLSVEMLKKKSQAQAICDQFGYTFRSIVDVQSAFKSRPIPDEALCALLWEYKSRGQKGYDLSERFFELFNTQFPMLTIIGPKRAGQDIRAGNLFADYPNPKRPLDFVIYDEDKQTILAVGLVRYDGDRGGAQEDDRVGGYRNCADELLGYAQKHDKNIKILFVNDGPCLLLGSMWDDYSAMERRWDNKIMVATLRMIPTRLTYSWLKSEA